MKHEFRKLATVKNFRMDVLTNDNGVKRIFHLEIRTHFVYAACELVDAMKEGKNKNQCYPVIKEELNIIVRG